MAKGLELKNTGVIKLIAKIYYDNPLWSVPKVHKEVLSQIHDENSDYYEPYVEDPEWPRQNTIYKHWKEISENDEARSPQSKELDKPWTLDALRDTPLPPEVLPKLFPIWLKKQEDPFSPPLSIREAKWITQLSSMTNDIELLRITAELCAEWELIGELTNTAQLSPPLTMLWVFSQLTGMDDKELEEHHQDILREKQVSSTQYGEILEGLKAFHGDKIIKAVKSKPKGEAQNERQHTSKD